MMTVTVADLVDSSEQYKVCNPAQGEAAELLC